MEKDENQTGYTLENGNMGQVQIADEVVAIIAGLAATEVEGVASMAGNITNELVSKLGKKSLSKGIRVKVEDGIVNVNGTQHCIWIQRTEDLQKGSGKGKSSDREYDRS